MNRIRELRKKMGVSMNSLAKKLQIAESTLGYWERGVYEPSRDMLIELSAIFQVPIDYILGNDDAIEMRSGNWIPVYGKVQAGLPIEATEDIIDQEELAPDMVKDGSEYMALQIRGHSMEPRIREGDVVIIRLQPDVESGEVAVVFINGDEATCKQIKKTPEGVSLISFNPAFDPMFFTNEEVRSKPLTILGKVVELRAKF